MKEKILSATNGGRDIIEYYLPDSSECFGGKRKYFKLRPEENHASATVTFFKDTGMWYVKDFGDGTSLNPFEVAMNSECLSFRETLLLLADRYNVSPRLNAKVNISNKTYRPATSDEKEGEYYNIQYKSDFSESEMKVWGATVTKETLQKYSYYSVESYEHTFKSEKTGELTTMKVVSSANFPIFAHDCGTFKKIYCPLAYEKKEKFFYVPKGNVPPNYINGLDVLKKDYSQYIANIKEEDKETPRKLPEVIICSGERDSMNVASLGYYVIWLNSESATIDYKVHNELLTMCNRIYNIPDIDSTGIRRGRELSLKYLDIFTIVLPQTLKRFKDNRGKERKDIRDYLDLKNNQNNDKDDKNNKDDKKTNAHLKYEFLKLYNTALCCQFWEKKIDNKGRETHYINTEYLLHYLVTNGFAKIKIKKIEKYAKIDGYKVIEYQPKEIRSFIYNDLKNRYIDNTIINLFLNSNKTDSRLADDLPTIELNFDKYTHDSRTFFFKNESITVTANDVKETQISDINSYVWEENICPHNFKLIKNNNNEIEKQFDWKFGENGSIKIIYDTSKKLSNYFCFLMNASRIYWRKEFEERITGNTKEDENYRINNKFNVNGSRLTIEEQNEQVTHLVNKIYAIGYLLHRYKKKSRALALWLMENKLTEANESSGGSGKSFSLEALKLCGLLNIASLNGRDKRITENKHLLDRVDTITDVIQIDDTDRMFDFNYFYGMITNSTSINKKNQQSEELDFKDAPIFAFTSNFPPPNSDGSTMRRLLTVVFSDYYHELGVNGQYKETRKISDDFQKDLYDELYTEEEYNLDINFFINCLQFYLSVSEKGMICYPPMDNVVKRINIAKMGEEFKNWADVYFAKNSGKLNRLLNKNTVFIEFSEQTGVRNWKVNRFSKALQAFADNNGYLLNPDALCNSNRRIIKNIGGKSTECIYFKTDGEPINDSINLL